MVNSVTSDAWVTGSNSNSQASLRLFCFPYAGGNTSIFRAWSSQLPPNVEVCPIQLPGRASRWKETPFTHMEPLVEALAQAITPYLDLPFAFFGHSMGALISFELARYLRIQQAPQPIHLFLSGRRAPQIGDRNPLMHTLPDQDFLAELHHLNGTPRQVLENVELMELFLPILRADFSICGTYTYADQPPLNCAISVFGGLEDATEPHELLEPWRKQTCSSFALHLLPGDHFFLQTNQDLLLRTLSQILITIHPNLGLTADLI
jgi:medium-chain acyl-[acyl-carrier-protein] hydrolase